MTKTLDACQAWPGAAVELVPTNLLLPYARNARTHSPEQIAIIADLMLSHGFTNQVLRDEANGIIAGHGRVLAAGLNVGRGHKQFSHAPCITARGWTEEQKRGYVLADNQTALRAGWDMALLGDELTSLSAAGVDLESFGFGKADLRSILGPGGFTDPDAAPAAPEVPVSKLGDLYALGPHRLLCGNATVAADVERLLGGARPHLMVTDPPYGVDYNPTWRDSAAGGKFRDHKTKMRGAVLNDNRVDWREAWALFSGDVAYVWHASLKTVEAAASLESSGFVLKGQIIWAKQQFTLARSGYHWQHEPCWYAVRDGATAHWLGDRKQTTVWEIHSLNPMGSNNMEQKTGHGTQKPVECMRRPIMNNSAVGDAVYDPFLGSGTTIIAAEMEGRACFGLEISPAYCDVIVKRWEDFTGKKAARLNGAAGT